MKKINVIIVKNNGVIVSMTPYNESESDCITLEIPVNKENVNDHINLCKNDIATVDLSPEWLTIEHWETGFSKLENLLSEGKELYRSLEKKFLDGKINIVGDFTICDDNITLPAKFGVIEILSDVINVEDFTTEQLQYMYDDAVYYELYDGDDEDEFISELYIKEELEKRLNIKLT